MDLRQSWPVMFACLFGGTMVAGTQEHVSAEEEMTHPAKATFAGGCFWCMEGLFDHVTGVLSTTVGYTGGTKAHPTYDEVSSSATGHAEAVEVVYDPSKVSYEQLLEVFWRNIDPTTPNQQFTDTGSQYRTAIFHHTEEQRRFAEESKARLERSGTFDRPIVTEIISASTFYPAEEYHQDYYRKQPVPYTLYRIGSGREAFLKRVWGEAAH
jgi:methionine-S-sulfoxide reductase